MKIDLWRTNYHTINGFRQFYRDRPPRDESLLPVLALHGSLTQSGMWVTLAEAADSFRTYETRRWDLFAQRLSLGSAARRLRLP